MLGELGKISAGSLGTRHPIATPAFRHFVSLTLACIALSPMIAAIVTWDADGKLSTFSYGIRRFWLMTMIPEMFFVGSAMWISAASLRSRRWKDFPKLSSDQILWLISFATLLVSGLYAGGVLDVVQTVFWLFHISVVWSGCVIFLHIGLRMADWFWLWLGVGALSYSLLFAVFFVLVSNPADYPWGLRPPGFTNIRHIGYFVGPAAIVSVGALASNRKISTSIILTILFLELLILLWTGSRGAIFAFTGSFLVSLCVFPQMRSKNLIVAVCLTALVASAFSLLLPTPTGSFGVLHRIVGFAENGTIMSDSGRVEIWMQTIPAIIDRPLLGYGLEGFRPFISNELGLSLNHPHNLILQFAFNWGVPVAIILLVLFLRQIKAAFKIKILRKNSSIIPAMVLINMGLFSLYDGPAYYALPVFVTTLSLAHLISLGVEQNSSSERFA